MRRSTRSARSGLTWMVTSGVFTSNLREFMILEAMKEAFSSGCGLKIPVEIFQLFFIYPAYGQEIAHLSLAEHDGIGTVLFFFCQLVEIVMNLRTTWLITGIPQGFLNQLLKNLFLILCGEGQGAAQQAVRKIKVQILRIFGIVEQAVDVAAAVIKCGEEKAQAWEGPRSSPGSGSGSSVPPDYRRGRALPDLPGRRRR